MPASTDVGSLVAAGCTVARNTRHSRAWRLQRQAIGRYGLRRGLPLAVSRGASFVMGRAGYDSRRDVSRGEMPRLEL